MTYRFMLDTNTVSDVLRQPTGAVARRIASLPVGSACVSIITAAELRFGARKVGSARIWQKISDFTKFVPALPFEHRAEEIYAEIRAALEGAGRPIGPNDLLIAAQALSLDLTVVTANVREFSRVAGLRVENWLDL